MDKRVVLFLCTGNSARSQMAEALLRRRAGDRFDVYSAGLEPRGIHPMTVRVMEEVGVNMEGHRSKPLNEFLGSLRVQYAITVCQQAEQSCPSVWPFTTHRLFWPFEDPAAFEGTEAEQLQTFREVRDRIDERIERWLTEEGALA